MPVSVQIPDLRKIQLFGHLPDSALEAICAASRVVDFAPHQVVLQAGDEEAPVFCVLAGRVRVFRMNLDGREQTLITLRPGAVFNLPAAFLPSQRSPASAMAESEARLLEISLSDFRRVASQVPEVALAVLGDLSVKLQHFTTLAHDLSLLSVRARLARFLLESMDRPADETAHWTQEEIAARIGTVREVVSRTMRAFVQEGLIRLDRQRIVIEDADTLAAIAAGE